MAHPTPRRCRLAGNKANHRLPNVFFDVGCCTLFRVTADFANHHNGVRIGVFVQKTDRIRMIGTNDGIAADPDTGRLANPQLRELAHSFVSQSAGARNDTDVAFQMDVPWHDADLALTRRDDPGAVRANQARSLRLQIRPDFHHVDLRNAFGDADNQGDPGVGRFHDAVRRKGWRNKDHGRIRAGFFHGLGHGVEHRAIQMGAAALAGGNTTHNIGAISNRLRRVERAFAARETLHQQASIFINQYGH